MSEYEEIVFNDADGSDEDLYRIERFHYTIYEMDCSAWDDPYFFVSSGEFANSIIYDDQKEDIRYSVILAECGAEDYRMRQITMFYGKSICSVKDFKDHKYTKSLSFHSDQYTYKSFLVYDENKKVIPSLSKDKLISMVNKFMNLRAFL